MMAITDRAIDQAFTDLKQSCGGRREDYFGLLYLEKVFGLDRDRAKNQIAFGGHDYGIDGFHFDHEKRNLYLFQFKWSDSPATFQESLKRLIDAGMERVFNGKCQDQSMNQLLIQLKSCLLENEALIDRILIFFVFKGEPEKAERSPVLDNLRERLESKKYLIDQRFGKSVTLAIEFRSVRTNSIGFLSHARSTHEYPLSLDKPIIHHGPNGENMTIGLIRLVDLYKMYRDMGNRFFDQNIRGALPEHKAVNRSIREAIKRIVLEGKDDPGIFTFNHNGVTLFAEALDQRNEEWRITEPRLLNGAQTISMVAQFMEDHKDDKRITEHQTQLEQILVMCRIITKSSREFVKKVTINNNRQNPVKPWNFHANDEIQLQLQEKFQQELGIYYERQEKAFKSLSDDELEELGIKSQKSIELPRLANTFLASDGEIDKLSHPSEVFEHEDSYDKVFNQLRLNADARNILLCYKAQFRLNRIANAIIDKGVNKYAYVQRARNLLWAILCQAILNDPQLDERAHAFGRSLVLEAQYTDWLTDLATTRCRFILSDLVANQAYAQKKEEGNFSFLRTNHAYQKSMQIAHKRWKWLKKSLK